jgi:protein-S-isoprenylcysteine O-methyltransferase Ste14
MLGLTLILVPTIIYGGLVLLGIVSGGAFGMPGPRDLTLVQQAFYRAGHAHAGVLLILSLVLQILADHARLGSLEWPVRVAAPAAAVLVSAGFFGVAHVPMLRAVLYIGAALVAAVTVGVGVGLLRSR